MASSPMSPLSEISSDDLREDPRDSDREVSDDNESFAAAVMPPTKRRKVNKTTHVPTGYDSPGETLLDRGDDDWSDISSDTTGSVPGTPRASKDPSMADEETIGAAQLRDCTWDGCTIGPLINVDELVTHLEEDHVEEAKKTKYTCAWGDCKSRSKPHNSAYALRAHIRSHTKEKPFYCLLPECDKAFTRTDALAKHMRTVHDTEHSRAVDVLGRTGNFDNSPRSTPPHPATSVPARGPTKLKLVLSSTKTSSPLVPRQGSADVEMDNAPASPLNPGERDELFGAFPKDLTLTEDEAMLPRSELYRLLRRQVHWAQQESTVLKQDIVELDKQRRNEFMRKELVFENALEAEFERSKRKGVLADLRNGGSGNAAADDALNGSTEEMAEQIMANRLEGRKIVETMAKDASYSTHLPMNGQKRPWYREPQWKNQQDVDVESPDEADDASEDDSEKDDASDGNDHEPEIQGLPGDDDTEVEEQ